jgi:hypothetical protein
MKKGGSDPLSLFGPQAGRKEGVAPALLPSSDAFQFAILTSQKSAPSRVGELLAENRKETREENRFRNGFPVF